MRLRTPPGRIGEKSGSVRKESLVAKGGHALRGTQPASMRINEGRSIRACLICLQPDFVAMSESRTGNTFAVLRQFSRLRAAMERCELCSTELCEVHPHLLEPAARKVLCVCDACALLFCGGQNGLRYKRIPHRIRALSHFTVSDEQWESLMIPIQLAFFFRDSTSGRVVAMYPSPAGATESLLTLDAWEDIAAQDPLLQTMDSDVEALLVNRVGNPSHYFLVPIDECFRLVGIIRMHWKGLSGGVEVWREIQGFFQSLSAKCSPPNHSEAANA
jgi:hypothetical protein